MSKPALESIKLLVSDVDGTCVHPDKTVGPATIAAVHKLREAGIRFTIVSSRPPVGMLYPLKMLGVDQIYGAYNGGTILNPDGSIVEAHRITAAAAKITLDMLARENIETFVFADNQWLVTDVDGEYVPRERHTIQSEPVLVKSFEPYLDRIDKITGCSSDHDRLAQIEIELAAAVHGQAEAVRSQVYYLDINDIRATKGYAVTALAKRMGVPLEQVAVIGDAGNDLPMFAVAGISFAMGQADDHVKQKASYVSASNAEDGVAVAIEKYLLPALGKNA